MIWYDRLFPPLMIILPLVMVLCVRPRATSEAQLARARRLTMWLVIGTIAGLAVWLALYLWVIPEQARHMFWLALGPLMPLAMRIMPLKNRDMGSPHEGRTVRAASLASRAHASPVPRWAWGVLWLVTVVCLGVMAARWTREMSDAAVFRWWVAFPIAAVLLPLEAALGPWAIGMVLREPEPMDASDSDGLRKAYARHRNERAWAFYGLFLVMTLMIGAGNAVLVWIEPSSGMDRNIGLWGGGVGAAIGMAGAGFGVWSGMRRARLNRMVRELDEEAPNAPVEAT